MRIECENLRFSYGSREILHGVTFAADRGELIAVLGPNGVGKSTLFRCLLGFLRPSAGTLRIAGREIAAFSRRELAREIAYIPQSYQPAFDHTVLDCVLMGATARVGTFSSPSKEQTERAAALLESLGVADLAGRGCQSISGGEQQLMLLARALMQDAGTLIMDEPTANLDYGNACRVMERVESLAGEGYTVIFSTHEPNHGLRYATRVLAIQRGAVLADGAPDEVLSPALLSALYGVEVLIGEVRSGDKSYRVCVPVSGKSAE